MLAANMKGCWFGSINSCPMKQAVMNNENQLSNLGKPTVRVTRARAKALGSSSGLPPLYPSAKQDDKQVSRGNLKRAASDNNKLAMSSVDCPQRKKRAVLKDVTNIKCDHMYINCMNAARGQVRLRPSFLRKYNFKFFLSILSTQYCTSFQVQRISTCTPKLLGDYPSSLIFYIWEILFYIKQTSYYFYFVHNLTECGICWLSA